MDHAKFCICDNSVPVTAVYVEVTKEGGSQHKVVALLHLLIGSCRFKRYSLKPVLKRATDSRSRMLSAISFQFFR